MLSLAAWLAGWLVGRWVGWVSAVLSGRHDCSAERVRVSGRADHVAGMTAVLSAYA